jgi:hypothetical protein
MPASVAVWVGASPLREAGLSLLGGAAAMID